MIYSNLPLKPSRDNGESHERMRSIRWGKVRFFCCKKNDTHLSRSIRNSRKSDFVRLCSTKNKASRERCFYFWLRFRRLELSTQNLLGAIFCKKKPLHRRLPNSVRHKVGIIIRFFVVEKRPHHSRNEVEYKNYSVVRFSSTMLYQIKVEPKGSIFLFCLLKIGI